MKLKRKRWISNEKLTREQALWLCRAIWTHYRSDPNASDVEFEQFNIPNRADTRRYKRGRDWIVHPLGYDLKEVWYGSHDSGFREAWAALVSLPISQGYRSPQEHRTYTAYGLLQRNQMTVAVYHVTEVKATSADENFLSYVFQCFSRLADDASEIPEYDPRGRHNQRRSA